MNRIGTYLVDETTGEIYSEIRTGPQIGKGGLYAPYPIPAVDTLVRAGEIAAKDVLLCLVDFLGMGDNEVYPSLETIRKFTRRGKPTIISATKILKDFGFIKVVKRQNKTNTLRAQNYYYILDACFDYNKMNDKAKAYRLKLGSCHHCGGELRQGEVKKFEAITVHWGCSGKLANNGAEHHPQLVKKMVEATSPNELATEL